MKKTILSLFSLSIVLVTSNIVLTSSSNGRAFAARSGNTGAPSESTTCRSCHGSGFGTTVEITITDTSGTVVTDYIPGDTLNVEVEVKTTSGSPSHFGFQIVSLTSTNVAVNDWVSPDSTTRIASAGNRTYAEHKGKSTTRTFSSKWVAPIGGTGSVTFYAGGAAVNNNRGTSGDGGNTTTASLTENVSASIGKQLNIENISIYPNPTNSTINLDLKGDFSNVIIEIRDISGKLVRKTTDTTVDVQSLEKGMYMLCVENNEGLIYQSKFLKQ